MSSIGVNELNRGVNDLNRGVNHSVLGRAVIFLGLL